MRTTVAGPVMTDGDIWRERAIRDAVLAGDAEAWRQWYDAHFDRLAAYARWRCGGLRDLADDVVQETWLVAVRRLGGFDPAKGAFFDWLCGIVSNATRSAIRARGRRAARVRPLAPADDRPAVDPGATTDTAERVAAALAALPDHYERVLRAKYLDRLTVDEIAAARADSPKAVESLLARPAGVPRSLREDQ
ncbi:RNA polymerase sigma factor [Frigoriglobus tundricola]|uniref:Sigma-24 (FecI-like) protein n=1 Tax=Frigoriglobus tundricola TaxID=2774151 RepID=A0A6M5YRR5_9BACT|nr:RNA polymerase sigma factor [Frigoriglobus tundricola]QJW95951.1 sigma-24 (FecI-like) protein [Frigoriglobus tundricola]